MLNNLTEVSVLSLQFVTLRLLFKKQNTEMMYYGQKTQFKNFLVKHKNTLEIIFKVITQKYIKLN